MLYQPISHDTLPSDSTRSETPTTLAMTMMVDEPLYKLVKLEDEYRLQEEEK